jgi:hypothetical protein
MITNIKITIMPSPTSGYNENEIVKANKLMVEVINKITQELSKINTDGLYFKFEIDTK